MRRLAIFLLSLFAFATVSLNGQCADILPACGSGTFVQHLEQGTTISQVFNQGYFSSSSADWSFCLGAPAACSSPTDFGDSVSFGGLTLRENAFGEAELTGMASTAGKYEVSMQVESGGSPPESRNYIFVIREPLHLVFVLDKSGSMANPAPSSGTTASSKWSVVGDGIQHFVNSLANLDYSFIDGDRVGLIAFNEDAVVPPAVSAGQIGDFNTIPNFRALQPLVFMEPSFRPQGWTSIGDGMLHANGASLHNGLTTGVREASIIISDGMQNRPAEIDGGGKKIVGSTGANLLNSGGSTGTFIDTYTIGFMSGTTPGAHDNLLSSIAIDGDHYFPTLHNGNYNSVFTEVFTKVFQQFSPQIVDLATVPSSRDAQEQQVYEKDFLINNDVSGLIFQVNFPSDVAGRFRYELLKDGSLLSDSLYRLNRGRNSVLLTVNVQSTPNLESGGTWTLRAINAGELRSAPTTIMDLGMVRKNLLRQPRVSMSATVDEHNFRADYRVLNDPTSRKTGRAQVNTYLYPEATLNLRGQPVEDARVTARILEPGADKGTLISGIQIDYPGGIPTNPYTAKFNAILQQNPNALAPLYQLAENEILLTPQGGGRYTGRFGKLDVADNVAVIFRVSYQDSLLGMIQRYHRASVAVRFGELDQDWSVVSVTPGDNGVYQILYRPTYWNGTKDQLVGPGYASSFRVNGGQLQDVVDQGDGTYELQISGTEAEVYLLDEPLHSGPLKDFGKPTRLLDFSLHAGWAFPIASSGLLDSLADGGLLAELDLAVQIAPKWAVELIGGYYDYQPNDDLLGGSLLLRYRGVQPGQRFHWTAAGGAGYFRRDNGDSLLGLGLRLGAEYQVAQSVRVLAEIGGYAFDNIPDLGLASVGLKYRF